MKTIRAYQLKPGQYFMYQDTWYQAAEFFNGRKRMRVIQYDRGNGQPLPEWIIWTSLDIDIQVD